MGDYRTLTWDPETAVDPTPGEADDDLDFESLAATEPDEAWS